MKRKGTVFVGMSGGVDSSVSAYLLQKEGYDVVGAFIKVWHPDFLMCNWEEERLDAMRVAAMLGIPFLTVDAEDAYKREVADYFIREYGKGRTPNPDVMCNTHVKFGQFLEFAKKHNATHIATGHYVRTGNLDSRCVLKTGLDSSKDQSYFLWNVTEEALAVSLFPVGNLTKAKVRAIAEEAGLPTAEKKDSQGICFLGHVDVQDFLSHYLPLKEGVVYDDEKREIGTHFGAELYTIGQRHGFRISRGDTISEPYFVIAKDIEANTITVSTRRLHRTSTDRQLTLSHINIIGPSPSTGDEVECVLRYHGPRASAKIIRMEGNSLELMLSGVVDATALGQSCVLYVGDRCLGGGIIER